MKIKPQKPPTPSVSDRRQATTHTPHERVRGVHAPVARLTETLSFYRNISLLFAIPSCLVITYKVHPPAPKLFASVGVKGKVAVGCSRPGLLPLGAPPPPRVQGVESPAQAGQGAFLPALANHSVTLTRWWWWWTRVLAGVCRSSRGAMATTASSTTRR